MLCLPDAASWSCRIFLDNSTQFNDAILEEKREFLECGIRKKFVKPLQDRSGKNDGNVNAKHGAEHSNNIPKIDIKTKASNDSIFIQIADLLSGAVRFYLKDKIESRKINCNTNKLNPYTQNAKREFVSYLQKKAKSIGVQSWDSVYGSKCSTYYVEKLDKRSPKEDRIPKFNIFIIVPKKNTLQ